MRVGSKLLISSIFATIFAVSANADEIWVKTANQECSVLSDKKLGDKQAVTWFGSCSNGRATGSGKLEWIVDGKIRGTFEGEMDDGRLDGDGVMRVELEKGKGFDRLAGHFVDGQLEGDARYDAANGDFYEGGFKSGQRHGVGYYKMVSGEEYFGDFENGQRHGVGFLISANGDAYLGQFKNGLVAGQGVFEGGDGSKYQGMFSNGVPDGPGTLVAPNGDVYQGRFSKGKGNGAFLVTRKSDGTQTNETWKNGELVE